MPLKQTPEIIAAAIEGFESKKLRIDGRIAELRQMLRPVTANGAAPAPAKRKRKLSAAGRKAISDAVKKRWAATKAAQAQSAAAPAKAGRKKPSKRGASSARKSSTRRRGAAKARATTPTQSE